MDDKQKSTIETRMRKAKRKFLRIEMLVVRNEYQGQGFMRKMMEFTYHLADKKQVPVILDTDDKDKAARYKHLGMKLDRVRSCGERFQKIKNLDTGKEILQNTMEFVKFKENPDPIGVRVVEGWALSDITLGA